MALMTTSDAERDAWLESWLTPYKSRLQNKTCELWKALRNEFIDQGYPLGVRQMFYRMETKGVVEKSEAGVRKVQDTLTNMRKRGAIPYYFISDNSRPVYHTRRYSNPAEAAEYWAANYRRSLWQEQDTFLQFWIEKDGLSSIFYSVTDDYDVPLHVARGYPSLSFLYSTAQNLIDIGQNKRIVIAHFGDYDPSGVDAARFTREQLEDFGAEFEFVRVAVTESQIASYNLPTRPTKKTDTRARHHGDISVELDAIPPAELRALARKTIEQYIDPGVLSMSRLIEREERTAIQSLLVGRFGTSTKTA